MKWRIYKDAFVLGLGQLTNYRTEMWFQIISKLLSLTGIGVLWAIILRNAPTEETKEMAGYLLVSNGVRELVDAFNMRYAARIMDDIKDGSLNSALLRPTNPYRLSYFSYFGTRGINLVMSLIMIGLGIVVFPPRTWATMGMFLVTVIFGLILSYWINLFIGWLGFWVVTAPNIRALFIHVVRVFSGAMVPINYFPEGIRIFALLTPFPALAYVPAKILQKGYSPDFGIAMAAAVGWMAVFMILENRIWQKGLKRYEAVGI